MRILPLLALTGALVATTALPVSADSVTIQPQGTANLYDSQTECNETTVAGEYALEAKGLANAWALSTPPAARYYVVGKLAVQKQMADGTWQRIGGETVVSKRFGLNEFGNAYVGFMGTVSEGTYRARLRGYVKQVAVGRDPIVETMSDAATMVCTDL